MLNDAFHDNDLGALIRFRTDGNVFNLRRLNSKTRTSKVLIRDLLFADDCALRTDDQSEENRGDLSAKARSRLHNSNHHNRQQPTESHWQVQLLGQHDITERIDWRRDLGTDWQSERVVRQTHQATLERTQSAVSYQNQCVQCGCATNTAVWVCEAWTPYRRHIQRLDQFHMRCLRRIANIKWQDMIPNTEVIQRCAQTGIEQHIKCAQLRWSRHLVRMADDRIPKDVFYEELAAGHRTRGGQRKRYKDVLKATLKSCGIPHNTWEATATDCPLWRSTCHSGLRDYEENRCDPMRDKRMRRKAIQPSSNIDTFLCHVCGRLCASRIGLHSHNRPHAKFFLPTQTLTEVEIRHTDGSFHILFSIVLCSHAHGQSFS